MTLYNHCGIPLAYNDERKPSFVRYEDYREAVGEIERHREKAAECERKLVEIIGRLYMNAID